MLIEIEFTTGWILWGLKSDLIDAKKLKSLDISCTFNFYMVN